MSRSVRKVVAIVANVKQFRLAFYDGLAKRLAARGVEFSVLYSDPDATEARKRDSIELPVPVGRKIRRLSCFHGRVLLQFPPVSELKAADLIIVVQANGYLFNYALLFLSAFRLKRVAYWGHGYNHQGARNGILERFKRRMSTACDWWFTYTESTAEYLVHAGMPRRRITVIENAIDTATFGRLVFSISDDEVARMRSDWGIGDAFVALYCGSLYKEKRLGVLLDSVVSLRAGGLNIVLIVLGAGPEEAIVEKVAKNNPGAILYLGAQFGRTKALSYRVADVIANPGLVGLGILDGFAAGVPLITTRDAAHSPEIAYLDSGVNGLMVSGDEDSFSEALTELATNSTFLKTLREGARNSGSRYTVENMINNVEAGVIRALSAQEEV